MVFEAFWSSFFEEVGLDLLAAFKRVFDDEVILPGMLEVFEGMMVLGMLPVILEVMIFEAI